MTTTAETLLAPPDQELSPERLDGCEEPSSPYKVVPSVVCSMCCLFGIIYCFFGESGMSIFSAGGERGTRNLSLCVLRFQATAASRL